MYIIDPLEIHRMGRIGICFSIGILLIAPLLSETDLIVADDKPISGDPIIIDGDVELLTSEYLQGGNGLESNPYVLSGFSFSISGLIVKNITSWIEIRDHTFDIDTEGYPVYIHMVKGCILENISVTNDNFLIKVTGRTNLTMKNSHFICSSINDHGIYPVSIGTSQKVKVTNSTFRTQNYDNSVYEFSNYYSFQSDILSILNSRFDKASVKVKVSNNDRILLVSRCTFANGSVVTPGNWQGNSISNFNNCDFKGAYINVGDCFGYQIVNNTFTGGGSYIQLGWLGYSPFPQVYSLIKGNIFEKSMGLYVSNRYSSKKYIIKVKITENYFGNCTSNAIYFLHYVDIDFVFIWKNIFYHNIGTGDVYSNVSQVGTSFGYFNLTGNTYLFHRNGLGNYWQDWTGPDENNDGIVDEEYLIRLKASSQYDENITDPHPVTNRYFDVERPGLSITQPSEPVIYHDMEYIRIEWEAWDHHSGIDRVLISPDNENWTDVTDEDWWPVKLIKGEHEIFMIAYDRAGLYNRTSKIVKVTHISGPITLNSPKDGDILLSDVVDIKWTVDSFFPLSDQKLRMDSGNVEIGLSDRTVEMTLQEGSHTIELTCWDPKECNFTKEADFIVDLTPPIIEIMNPYEGGVFSNVLMNFNWSVYDLNGLFSVRYRLDEDEWIEVQDLERYEASDLIPQGTHLIEVEAVDIAGRITTERVNFTIGYGTLKIVEPEDGHVTNDDQVDIKWIINEDFVPVAVELEYIEQGRKINVSGSNEYRFQLPTEGKYRFQVTAEDEFGNQASDNLTVFRDLDPPLVDIFNDEFWVNDRPMIISWGGLDNYGISGYQYRFDDGEWNDARNATSIDLGEPDEGTYTFEVKCTNRAGNNAVDQYRFHYDITAPEVGFVVVSEPMIQYDIRSSLHWIASDANGISEVVLFVGEKEYELSDTSTNWEGSLDDGTITIQVIVTDPAGNTANDTKVMIVDTADPTIEWSGDTSSPTNLETIPIGWISYDEIGIREVILYEDDVEVWSGSSEGVHGIYLTPDEGNHSYLLSAVDISGRTASIQKTIFIDRAPPVFCGFDYTIKNGILDVEWSFNDNLTSVMTVIIGVEEQSHETVMSEGTWSFDGLEPGSHVIYLEAVDEAGNSVEVSVEINIRDISDRDESNDDFSWGLCLLSIFTVLVVIILIIASIVFLVKKWKKDEEPEEMELDGRMSLPLRNENDRLQVGSGFKAAPRLTPALFDIKINNEEIKR